MATLVPAENAATTLSSTTPSSRDDRSSNDAAAAAAEAKAAKRVFEFNMAHELKFGLEVAMRDDATGRVLAALCRFCKHFGREEKEGRKRRATTNVKHFKPSFRTDQYMQHLLSQHPCKWTVYAAASESEKRAFFPAVAALQPPSSSNSSSSAGDINGNSSRVPKRATNDDEWSCAVKKPRLAPAPAATMPDASTSIASASDVVAVAPAAAVASSAAAPAASSTVGAGTKVDETSHWFELRRSVVDYVVAGSSCSSTGAFTDDAPDQLWRPRGFRCCELVHPRTGGDDDASTDSTATTTTTDSSNIDGAVYRVAVRSRVQLDLAVDFLAAGQTPRQIARALHAVVARAGLDPVLAASETDATELVQLSAAVSLDAIARLLEQSWAFAIGVHTAAHASHAAIRVRALSPSGATVCSAHVMVLPLAAATDATPLFERFARAMDAVLPAWRRRVVGVSSDGAAAQCNRVVELIACIEREATHTVYRTWCYSDELNAAMQQFYGALLGGAFVASFTALTAYIRSQESLVREMGPPPSATSSHPWLAMGNDTKWMTDKRVRLRKHLEEDRPVAAAAAAAPDDAWWVAFFVVYWVAGRANEAFKRLQSRHLLVAQQTDVLADMASDLVQAFNVQGPLSATDADDAAAAAVASDSTALSRQRRFAVSSASVRDFLADLGVFVNNIVARVEPAALDAVVTSVAVSLANLVEALADMAPEASTRTRSSSSDADNSSANASGATGTAARVLPPVLPPVLPHELAQLSGREFATLLERHDEPLRAFFNDEGVDRIDQEHQALRRASVKEKSLKAALLECDDETPFERAWALTLDRFPALQRFAGGLTTVFAAADVASSTADATDISVTDAGGPQVDASLERVLHAQQFHELQSFVQRPPTA